MNLSEAQAFLEQRVAAKRKAEAAADVGRGWAPLSGPQALALDSAADVLLYGGAAGGGKTDLALGKALTRHRRTLILRREFPQLKGIRERSLEVYAPFGTWNGNDAMWRVRHGGVDRTIELGSCQHEWDKTKYQGRPHDLKVFDEAANFLESQVRFISGWNRTEVEGQRCQILLCSNPPTGAEGLWLLDWFAAWLDEKHPNPAAPGELRWFAMVDGKDIEVGGPEPFRHRAETVLPKSRTFIPARVTDNPYYMKTGYISQLQALPEPLRSMMLNGDFVAGQQDNAFQVIPTAWVKAAQARWRPDGGRGRQMTAVGADIARGGRDETVLSPRFDNWWAEQIAEPGTGTPNGPAAAALILQHRRDNALVNVDVIGVGASVYDQLRAPEAIGDAAVAVHGAAASTRRDKSGRLGFINLRAEMYWSMREALDPASGEDIALPPDRQLLADLCAPTFRLTVRGIQVESKEDIVHRLGRSPDRGDAAVYARAFHWLHEPTKAPLPPVGSEAWGKAEAERMESEAVEAYEEKQAANEASGWEGGWGS